MRKWCIYLQLWMLRNWEWGSLLLSPFNALLCLERKEKTFSCWWTGVMGGKLLASFNSQLLEFLALTTSFKVDWAHYIFPWLNYGTCSCLFICHALLVFYMATLTSVYCRAILFLELLVRLISTLANGIMSCSFNTGQRELMFTFWRWFEFEGVFFFPCFIVKTLER